MLLQFELGTTGLLSCIKDDAWSYKTSTLNQAELQAHLSTEKEFF